MTMINYVSKNMNLSTSQAMISQDLVGSFRASSSDFCDVMISALISLKEDGQSRWDGKLLFKNRLAKKMSKTLL